MSWTCVAVVPPKRFGRSPELWEDPDRPFGCEPRDLEGYAERQDWVLLFNAIMLAVTPEQAE
jgi:hypothetical protein